MLDFHAYMILLGYVRTFKISDTGYMYTYIGRDEEGSRTDPSPSLPILPVKTSLVCVVDEIV